MKLATRLWMLGALLPSAVMLAALLLAGQAFRAALESSLDRGLLAQGAAESVSLFDREEGPHLHMAESPLLEAVRPFAPTGELFDDARQLVAHSPPAPHPLTESPAPSVEGPASELLTREDAGRRERVLLVRVRNPNGHRYVLRLAASLAQVDESVRTFHVVALVVVLVAGAFLLAVQTLLARRLSARLAALSVHLERVKRGELDRSPAPDAGRDEVSALREVLAAATTQLQRARQVQDRLLADAAHELRTPLTLMRTTLDLALRRERSADELRRALEEARHEVDRLAELATALLDMAAAGRAWDTTAGALRHVLEEAAEAARAAAEERGLLLFVDAPEAGAARFNGPAFRQAVDNLLSNALRFAPAGSTITLGLRRVGAAWEVSVSDTGPGIAEAQRELVFTPFMRGDPRGGLGLGLAIASEVMRQHGGSAFIAPTDGPGARVVLSLPAQA